MTHVTRDKNGSNRQIDMYIIPPHLLRRALANGVGRYPPPCGSDTGQWNRDSVGAPLAYPAKGMEGGVGG